MNHKIIILSGPTAVGKTSVLDLIHKQRKETVYLPVSVTTRPPRPGEANHKSYHFISKEDFHRLIDTGKFLEWNKRGSGHFYGTTWDEFDRAPPKSLKLLDLDPAGAFAVRARFPSACLIFLLPPPPELETIERRLRSRKDNMPENELHWRLAEAKREMELSYNFNYIVINDNLDKSVQQILEIIDSFIENTQ